MTTDKVTELISVYCPSCGHNFNHEKKGTGRTLGAVGGAIAGAKVGAGVGLVGGPLGAIAGTIPGAALGLLFGGRLGRSLTDDPKCPKCATKFELPRR
jgi:uncharacterized membrane protein